MVHGGPCNRHVLDSDPGGVFVGCHALSFLATIKLKGKMPKNDLKENSMYESIMTIGAAYDKAMNKDK